MHSQPERYNYVPSATLLRNFRERMAPSHRLQLVVALQAARHGNAYCIGGFLGMLEIRHRLVRLPKFEHLPVAPVTGRRLHHRPMAVALDPVAILQHLTGTGYH